MLKGHGKHLLMCVPMIVLAGVLLATGSQVAVLLPVVGCVVMMGLMMSMMSGGAGDR